jgi:hypothetical protein
MNTNRFGIHYNSLKMIFNKLNPPRERCNKENQAFGWGFLAGSNGK